MAESRHDALKNSRRSVGTPTDITERFQLMFDLMALALSRHYA